MPKTKQRTLTPRFSGPCPNPTCSSRVRLFKNLQKHLGQKQDCREYLHVLRTTDTLKNITAVHHMMANNATFFCQPTSTTIHDDLSYEPMDDPFPLQDDASMPDTPPVQEMVSNVAPTDFEQAIFNQFLAPDAAQFLVNPNRAIFTDARRIEVTLLKILTEIEAPLWSFKIIMDWARDAAQSGYKFIPQQQSYTAQLETISKWVGMEHMKPEVVKVPLPGARPDDKIPVTKFDFISQLHSLLSDGELNTEANLVINPDAPFTRYTSPDGLLKECLSGSWYQHAWDHMITNTNCNYMIPIILYIDKTQMSLSGKLSIFPVQMSLGIFKEETRRTARAWRPLGYIANEDYYYSAAERDVNSPNVKNERFHTQLHEILQSFRQAQEPNALSDISLQLGTAIQRVNLYVPLQFIIGDVEGGDQLCSRWSYRGTACKRLCRTCDVSTANAARTDLTCTRIRVADVQNLISTGTPEALADLAQRPGFNSLYTIDCGGDPYGVFSMIHTEGLHAIEVGLIPYMLEILLKELSKDQKRQLDDLVKRFTAHPKQHGYNPFPRLLWQDGVTTITLLTGDLKVGKMFAIVAAALTLEGQQFFEANLPGGEATWKKMLYVFQQILCYWTWLKQETFWMAEDQEACDAATTSIKIMMDQLQTLWPRRDGLEWNLTKLHEQFHVPADIQRMGNHKNVHTGPQEHNHISIKKAARKTQLHKKKLDFQTGRRVMERLVIQRAYDFVKQAERIQRKTPRVANALVNSSKAYYHFTRNTLTGHDSVIPKLTWRREKYQGLTPLLHEHIIRLLITELFLLYAVPRGTNGAVTVLKVPFFTEYERNGFVYRAHPNYRGEGAYYDWAKIKWQIGVDPATHQPIHEIYIGRILGFIKHPNGETKAIVHSVMECPDGNVEHGVFGNYHHLEFEGTNADHWPLLHIVEVESLLEHVCMIPYTDSDSYMWVHLWHPSEWPGCFQTIVPPGEEGNVVYQE
jgi:hypothetical protein